MRISEKGINLIKKYEGCRLDAYLCPAGVWTIGYGHTSGVKPGMKITQKQADDFLKSDLEKFEKKVNKYRYKYSWNQNEFDALVSFAFNLGNIDQLTMNGTRSKKEIALKILEYNKAAGKELEGLNKRRKEERELFLTPMDKSGCLGLKQSQNSKSNDLIIIHAYSKSKDGETYVSKNFQVKEFACKDGSDPVFIAEKLVIILQKIRDHFSKPVTITSAFRTYTHNKKEGGANYSKHLYGTAADFKVSGIKPKDVANFAETLLANSGGIGIYDSFTHIDVRKEKSRWNG